MDEMELLEQFCAEQPPPDPRQLQAARNQLTRQITASHPSYRTRSLTCQPGCASSSMPTASPTARPSCPLWRAAKSRMSPTSCTGSGRSGHTSPGRSDQRQAKGPEHARHAATPKASNGALQNAQALRPPTAESVFVAVSAMQVIRSCDWVRRCWEAHRCGALTIVVPPGGSGRRAQRPSVLPVPPARQTGPGPSCACVLQREPWAWSR